MRHVLVIAIACVGLLFPQIGFAQTLSDESTCRRVQTLPALDAQLRIFFGDTGGNFVTDDMPLTEQIWLAISGPKLACVQNQGGQIIYGRRHRSGFEQAVIYLDRDESVVFVALRHHRCEPEGCSEQATITLFLPYDPVPVEPLSTGLRELTSVAPEAAFEVRRVEP